MNDDRSLSDPRDDAKSVDGELFTSLATRFDMPWEELEIAGNESERLAAFRALLADRLRFIIDHQFSRLAHILYRIDVDERRVDEIFRHAPIARIPDDLAELIIARVRSTLETRRRYREAVGGGIASEFSGE